MYNLFTNDRCKHLSNASQDCPKRFCHDANRFLNVFGSILASFPERNGEQNRLHLVTFASKQKEMGN